MALGALIPGVISAGASILGGVLGRNDANDAADAQKDAAKTAAASQERMFERSLDFREPYRNAGIPAIQSLSNILGLTPGTEAYNREAMADFRRNPAYRFAFKEGQRALDSSAAARGMLYSGPQAEALTKLGNNLGNQQIENYMARLFALAGIGGNAASGAASDAMQTGTQQANYDLAGGEAKASGIIGGGNVFNAGLADAGRTLGYLAERNPSAFNVPTLYG